MNLLLFIIVLVVSFVVVRIGAIAFQLTGLGWSMAKFQALSCFTSTGFTTKEAELVTATRQRRRIASTLIVLGHAGLVTMIATFANTIRPRAQAKLSVFFLPFDVPASIVPWMNLTIIVVAIYVVYKVFTKSRVGRRLTNALRERIIKKEIIEKVSFEELAIATGGYGVSKIAVCEKSPILNKQLSESQLRAKDVTVLAIVRDGETIPNPVASLRILLDDKLICFGKLENIRSLLCPAAA